MIAGVGKRKARKQAREILGVLGLSERESHRPARLFGAANSSGLPLPAPWPTARRSCSPDEPTGNLDHETALDVMGELKGQVRERGLAALVATHNLELAASMDRIVSMQDGVLVPG